MRKVSFDTFIKQAKEESTFLLICILLVLLIAGACYVIFLGQSIRYWDEEHYLLLAKNLHQGKYSFNGKDLTAFQPPGYPFVLYVLSSISSRLVFMRFANYVFLSGSIVCLFWMLKNQEGRLAALIGAILAAAYPLFFYTASTFYPQTFSTLLFLLILVLILYERGGWKLELSVGVLLGVLVLTIPAFLLYFPLWILYPWFLKKIRKLRACILLLVGCCIVVGSWTVRNAVDFDRFVLISSNSGINLLLGNSKYTTPESGVNANLMNFLAVGEKMNEFDQDAYYQQAALLWIQENPLEALELYLLKVLNFFNFKNQLAMKSEESTVKDVISFFSYYPLLLLASMRFLLVRKYPLSSFEWYLALIFICSPFLQAIFFTRIRFRVPIDMLMIYFCAATIGIFIKRRKWVY